ncbi:MAG TPA: PEP/pyruvate-binding domain-containing protein [Bacteroidales bacterium]|nr:PEP/pyruvate-binding domain-containing protein [Bacteroidales bacterium]
MTQPFVSTALEANLAETRYRDIYVPETFQSFINLSEGYFGIKKRAHDCIVEFHHPLSNRKFVVEELREILITDLWFYTREQIPADALLVPLGMLDTMLGENLNDELRTLIIKTLLEFVWHLMQKKQDSADLATAALGLLEKNFGNNRFAFILSTRNLVRYLAGAAVHLQTKDQAVSLTKNVLAACYDFWMESTRVEDLLSEKQDVFGSDAHVLAGHLGRTYFDGLREQLDAVHTWDGIIQMPVFDDIAARFADATELLGTFIRKFQFVFYLLHLPGMKTLGERLVWHLDRLIRQTVDELPESEIIPFIELIFELAEELRFEQTSAVLDFQLTLGLKVIDLDQSPQKEIVNHFEKKLIAFGFITPGMVFVDEDWQLSVNPNHIKNIRVWLQLIESSQSVMEKLLSALIVNLSLGGIFISDTDLFQREITKILNSNIAPYYKKVKQLTRIFPVYFNEIGAEGEIRKVTTTMDEVSGRQDKLIHFLRKQVHTESNNTLIDLTLRIFRFWYDGNLAALRPFLPNNVYDAIDLQSEWFAPVHQMVNQLCRLANTDPEGLLLLPLREFDILLSRLPDDNRRDKERLHDIHSLYAHLREKYSFEAVDIIQLLQGYPFIPVEEIEKFDKALKSNDYRKSLRLIYGFMNRLKKIIFNPAESESWEHIYHKRHIAIGIPSMYGVYREDKFEALGLTFRLEKVATRLMEKVVESINLDYISATTLEEINVILEYFRDGLELDGITNQSFNSNLQMLRYSLTSRSFSFDQYINIFQFLAQDVRRIIIKYFLKSYEYPLKIIIPQLFDPGNKLNDKDLAQLISRKSEEFHRDVIAEAFLVQPLDNFVARIMQSLRSMADRLDSRLIADIMTYNSEMVISPLDEPSPKMDNQVFLGSKAFHLKKLLIRKFPVPHGFVITSEVFRRNSTINALPALQKEFHELILKHLRRLERLTGCLYADADRPLLLSVRSGTAISMPGAMDTLLNVGLNDELATRIAENPRYSWAIWDSYRRLLQSWGMAHGIERDTFDSVMIAFKRREQVKQKVQFSAAQMEQIAMAYKQVLTDHNVRFEEDPVKQLLRTINMVFESWSSERAFVYRRHLQISDNWGTAVIVQRMVMGNIDDQSGTGVLFTQSPKRGRPGVHLFGDFTLRGQGEDIVAGLVKPLPVSETQRLQAGLDGHSLQSLFPLIYQKIYDIATDLTENHGYSPQEIEFTFESGRPEDLYILQTRDQDLNISQEIPAFTASPDDMKLLGRGMGIGGGAMNGLAAFDEADMDRLRKLQPGSQIILIRPDTVPDDIGMVFACDGLITARGGATSHAAVTAVRLGKTCVVNCIDLKVDEAGRQCWFNGVAVHSGDSISIDGNLGNIYAGHYPVETTLDQSDIRY